MKVKTQIFQIATYSFYSSHFVVSSEEIEVVSFSLLCITKGIWWYGNYNLDNAVIDEKMSIFL